MQLQNYVSQARFIQPNQNKAAHQTWMYICVKETGLWRELEIQPARSISLDKQFVMNEVPVQSDLVKNKTQHWLFLKNIIRAISAHTGPSSEAQE